MSYSFETCVGVAVKPRYALNDALSNLKTTYFGTLTTPLKNKRSNKNEVVNGPNYVYSETAPEPRLLLSALTSDE